MNSKPVRLAYLVSHPIQYQAPLLRRIAAEPDIDLTVYFRSDLAVRSYFDVEFGIAVEWDVPLLEGYNHCFLKDGIEGDASDLNVFDGELRDVLTPAHHDILWAHGYAQKPNLKALFNARVAGLKTFIRDEANAVSRKRGTWNRIMKRGFFTGLDVIIDRYLAIGTLNREYYLANGISPSKIFEVGYAVDNGWFRARGDAAAPNREAFRASLGLKPGHPVILYCSKLTARKHAYDLLEAWVSAASRDVDTPKPYLVIVGSGELEDNLKARAAELGQLQEFVRFCGFQNQTALPAFFDLCDVFVLPSENEPWGLIVNEVMSVGRAVITTPEVGATPDLVKDGENGFVVPVGDRESLTASLEKLVDDMDLCQAMGRKSREVIDTWGFDQNIHGLRAAIDSVELTR